MYETGAWLLYIVMCLVDSVLSALTLVVSCVGKPDVLIFLIQIELVLNSIPLKVLSYVDDRRWFDHLIASYKVAIYLSNLF